jgi:hypothetical protein
MIAQYAPGKVKPVPRTKIVNLAVALHADRVQHIAEGVTEHNDDH